MLTTPDMTLSDTGLDQVIADAEAALSRRQFDDGHWVFELEADATIPAEYVLLEHFLDRIDQPLQDRIGVYLRRIQGSHGGWPLYHDGDINLSASVKAYFALKAIGDDVESPHMHRAREAILALGGAARANVFTRFQLALYGEIPWHGTPAMPVEIMLLPRWFFFSIWNMSYWSRTVLAPLLVLAALKPRARNPRAVSIGELFTTPPGEVRDWNPTPDRTWSSVAFKQIDRVLRLADPLFPRALRRLAIRRAVAFVEERLNGEDGLGAIYPAMANSVMMYDTLGVPPDAPNPTLAWRSVRRLLVDREGESYCQPCMSPVWDTGLAGHAMIETHAGPGGISLPPDTRAADRLRRAAEWLRGLQVLDVKGDWAVQRPDLEPGGWAFQYRNDHYPDVDDTAVVAMLLHRQGDPANEEALERARRWIIGMQSHNGGWGAFDADNTHYELNHIPFADHGALLDPPSADVTARCISFLAQLGHPEDRAVVARAVAYLRREQEADGSWFGRWGTNYIYGTWSVLCALNVAGVEPHDPAVRRAVDWLLSVQRPDGGWGEDCASFEGAPPGRYKDSLPSQTAWAVLGLMAAGERDHDSVARGIAYLARTQDKDGEWQEEPYNAVGFPKVFYLRYHGYRMFFPLLALARYRNLGQVNSRRVTLGL